MRRLYKRIYLLFITVFAALTFSCVVYAQEATVFVNGYEFTSEVIFVNNEPMIPLVDVSEKLGFKIDFVEESNTTIIQNKVAAFYFKAGDKSYIKDVIGLRYQCGECNGVEKELPVTCKIVNDKLFVPISTFTKELYCKNSWNKYTNTIKIQSLYDFNSISDFNYDSTARVYDLSLDVYRFIDIEGNFCSYGTKAYDNLYRSTEHNSRYDKQDKFGVVNKEGIELLEMKLDGVDFYNNFFTTLLNDKYTIYNNLGGKILQFQVDDFQKMRYVSSDDSAKRVNYYSIKLNGKFGVMNEYGELLTPIIYENFLDAFSKTGMSEIAL